MYYIWSFAITSVISLFSAIFVLSKSSVSKTNVSFSLFSLCVAAWSGFYVLFCFSGSAYEALAWDRGLMTAAVFIPATFFHFTADFLSLEAKLFRYIAANYLISGLFALLMPSKLFVKDIIPLFGFPYWPEPGILFHPFFLWFGLCVIFAHYLLIKAFFAERGIKKEQIKYVFFGTLIGFIGGSTNYFMWYKIPIPPVGSPLVSVYVITIAYAITRYRLMDIDVIIRRGLLYTATTTVVTGLYVMAIYASNFLFNRFPGFNALWFMLPAIFILALLFQPIKNRLQEFIDRNFFKTKYEGDKIAHKFSDGVKKLMKTKELAEYITRSAMQTFKLYGAACFIYSEEKSLYVCEDGRGTMGALRGAELPPDLEMAGLMKKTGHLIVAEELQFSADKTRRVEKDQGSERRPARDMLEEMRKIGAVIAVPSISRKKDYRLIAFLVADRKKSEDAFSGSDIDLLENLAGQVAISIENAMLYEEQFRTIQRSMSIEKLADLGKATAGVAGEAQNALAYIEWFSNQLPEKKNDREFLLSQSRVLFAEVEKMRLLMQGVLEFSRPSVLNIEKIAACKAIDDVVLLVQETAAKQGIKTSVECEDGLEISADKNGIKQVLLNLLMNAIEAMPGGGQLSVKAVTETGLPVIYVSDTGQGIPSNIQQRMFEPFFTTKEHGIGLGLSIVDQAVKAMGGAVTFESEPGGGTTAKVVLQ